jgi:hypothetical protein
MLIAFVFLVLLLAATPVLLYFDNATATGLVDAILAAGLAIVAGSIQHGERAYVLGRIRPVVIVAAIPGLWFVVQLLPLAPLGLSHQIWASAQTALGRPTWGSISIDVGATAVALCRYLSAVGVLLLAAALAIDRRRAERVLLVLVAATVVIPVMSSLDGVAGLGLLERWDGPAARVRAMDCAALGLILAAAWAVRTLERREVGRAPPSAWALNLAFAAAAFLCCLLTLVRGTPGPLVAAGYGVATLITFVIIRRFALGPWAWAAAAAVALMVAVAIVTHHPPAGNAAVTLAFAADRSPGATLAVAQRMLADVPWTGTGAGTFARLVPMYRDAGEALSSPGAPTAAAAIEIELGRWMLAAIAIVGAAATILLLRAGLRRGRDSFYPAAGAACILTTLILGLTNPGVLGTANSVVLAAALGVAIAQDQSRSVR